jgi:hypothetical protein
VNAMYPAASICCAADDLVHDLVELPGRDRDAAFPGAAQLVAKAPPKFQSPPVLISGRQGCGCGTAGNRAQESRVDGGSLVRRKQVSSGVRPATRAGPDAERERVPTARELGDVARYVPVGPVGADVDGRVGGTWAARTASRRFRRYIRSGPVWKKKRTTNGRTRISTASGVDVPATALRVSVRAS